ncbi:hypothetical protein VPH35_111109 [Triticum aestivum]
MAEMAIKLKDATDHCEVLERERQAEQEDLKKVTAEAKDARSAMRAIKEELRQAGEIVAGKPFLLCRKFTDQKYAQLGQLWGAEDPYLDLAASAADAVVHFRNQKDHEMEELFWSQFHSPERSLPLTDRLAEWAELNRLSRLAMKDVVAHLWPERPKPKSYFGLVQKFLDAVPHIKAMKRSACIEGARMALARVKTYRAEMDATDVASRDLDRSRFPAEQYFGEVLRGARLVESQCSKNVMFK